MALTGGQFLEAVVQGVEQAIWYLEGCWFESPAACESILEQDTKPHIGPDTLQYVTSAIKRYRNASPFTL